MTAACPDMDILGAEPLAGRTTLGVGGTAEFFFEARHMAELTAALDWARENGLEVTILGAGSNVVVSDEGVPGLVVALGVGFESLEHRDEGDRVRVTAGGGIRLGRLTAAAIRRGWADLVFLNGIPGTLGGALMMNAGAHGEDMSRVAEGASLVNGGGRLRRLTADDLRFSYRRLALPEGVKAPAVVVEVELNSRRCVPDEAAARAASLLERRRQSQPWRQHSAGSFFKNPPGDSAGRLIESCGLKGARVGDAAVSDVHANFLVNLGRATAAEIMDLADLVRRTVRTSHGVELEPEVKFLGRGRERWPWL